MMQIPQKKLIPHLLTLGSEYLLPMICSLSRRLMKKYREIWSILEDTETRFGDMVLDIPTSTSRIGRAKEFRPRAGETLESIPPEFIWKNQSQK